MPRFPNALLRHAFNISPLLVLLLRTTRNLKAATNELRWLHEHVNQTHDSLTRHQQAWILRSLCIRRSRAEPLQYILGTQPFGELEIACKKGVLIPRPETENYTTYLSHLILSDSKVSFPHTKSSLKILDLCSGTGCISLLLHSLLRPPSQPRSVLGKGVNVLVEGWDISTSAMKLARLNLAKNIQLGHLSNSAATDVRFRVGDVFDASFAEHIQDADILICNPPYISEKDFSSAETERSVRLWEPKVALVPRTNSLTTESKDFVLKNRPLVKVRPEDIFYKRLMEFWQGRNIKIMVMEVGGEKQALRVAEIAVKLGICKTTGTEIQIWRDWVDIDHPSTERKHLRLADRELRVRGEGHMRSVVLIDEHARSR